MLVMVLSKRFAKHFRNRLSSSKTFVRSLKSEAGARFYEEVPNREAVLYVHWPFCAKRCTYCNFNKYVSDSVDHERMANCLAKETRTLIDLGQVSKINTVFFGGGTPSLALPSTISKVIDTVRCHADFKEDLEVTLEANPTHLTTERLREFRDAGITRLSLGVQAIDEKDLKILGRDHSAKQALRCLEKAKEIFPDHVSMDIIFGRPGQIVEQWEEELRKIVAVCDKHVSLYQLTLERGTPLYNMVKSGKCVLPEDESIADMYNLAVEILEKQNLMRYEISNFAEQGFESKHNQAYWDGEDYIGVGPGAHGRFTPVYNTEKVVPVREERIQALQPENWMYEVEKWGHATKKVVQQSYANRLKELIMLSLRTRHGLSSQRWSMLSPHVDLQDMFAGSDRVQVLLEEGFLIMDERGMRATSAGMAVLDSILSSLLFVLESKLMDGNS